MDYAVRLLAENHTAVSLSCFDVNFLLIVVRAVDGVKTNRRHLHTRPSPRASKRSCNTVEMLMHTRQQLQGKPLGYCRVSIDDLKRRLTSPLQHHRRDDSAGGGPELGVIGLLLLHMV